MIATHSPTVVSAANVQTITLVTQTGAETQLLPLDVRQAENQRQILAAVGASLADVFGADRILWVEGKTEELAFPLILEVLTPIQLHGTAVIGLLQTGDLQGRDRRRIYDIYLKLTQSGALIPPAVGFIFDSEELSDTLKDDLVRMSAGGIHFLDRRMYENYLLEESAITDFLNVLDTSRSTPIAEAEIKEWLERALQNPKYIDRRLGKSKDPRQHADAATILEDLFSEITETRVTYDKVPHDLALTTYLLQHTPGVFDEIKELLTTLLS